MFVAQSQKHASVEFCFGSRGENPPAQAPSLRDACLPPTHAHPHHATDSSYGTNRAGFLATGKVKSSSKLCLRVDFALCANTTGFAAYWSLQLIKEQTKPKSHPNPFEIHDMQT